MTTKVLFLLAFLALSTIVVHGQIEPGGDTIDYDRFKETYLRTSDEIAAYVNTAKLITTQGGDFTVSPDGQLITKPKSSCEAGPSTAVFKEPDIWYFPIPKFKQCKGLNCPYDYTCVAGNVYLRKFYTICYKLFNCWGKKIWIPIGIKRLCLFDETYCECKARCDPFSCFPPRRFNPKTCDCECPYIRCYDPYEVDPASCQCRCPKDIICYPPYKLDLKTCKCVCDVKCQKGYKPDPKQNCKCVPICQKRCPTGAYLDRDRCKCYGDCSHFSNEYDCKAIDYCQDYYGRKCKWDPSYPYNPCQCDCCQPKDDYADYDCSRFTGLGKFGCNFYYDWTTYANPCKWGC